MSNEIIEHKFLGHQINPDTKILLIGTFNPKSDGNSADFFYSRPRNYLWKLLPIAYGETELKNDSVSNKKAFMKCHHIDFIDLISAIKIEPEQANNFADRFIDKRVHTWQKTIDEMKKLKLARVGITRRTENDIPNMKIEIDKIRNYCTEQNIRFEMLPTPARFYNKKKQDTWTRFLNP